MSRTESGEDVEEVLREVAESLGHSVMKKMGSETDFSRSRIKNGTVCDVTKHLCVRLKLDLKPWDTHEADELSMRVEEVNPTARFAKLEKEVMDKVRAESTEFCDKLLEASMKDVLFLRRELKARGILYCSRCQAQMAPRKALQCSSCGAPYCSPACQKKHWKDHKHLCGCYKHHSS